MTAQELTATLRRVHAFSRVCLAQKLKVIRALQQSAATVAMIGDGINDSPASRAADVGIAIGLGGFSAARETADIFLATDDLGGVDYSERWRFSARASPPTVNRSTASRGR
ncbi:HAD family hydrolase [Sinorhizobium sp. 7-81]|uniref:HAD family hydrolase n=1 Tax=Sinorhizobium sp. 8-89 TaxID=3049089 RepID=UPI0024C243F6|nr:HAD family hydrolase [Sinorhizobium sp. 8-89]MDK1493178.1 HAD family hydrolase [Sinorhizobium sp. 8-89]